MHTTPPSCRRPAGRRGPRADKGSLIFFAGGTSASQSGVPDGGVTATVNVATRRSMLQQVLECIVTTKNATTDNVNSWRGLLRSGLLQIRQQVCHSARIDCSLKTIRHQRLARVLQLLDIDAQHCGRFVVGAA